jgi:hypothetical protein
VSTQQIRDGVCQWFGGPYDQEFRSYRIPQVHGLGVVRRGRPKRDDAADYYLGAPSAGAVAGAQMLVHVARGVEQRAAMAGPFGGLKLVAHSVTLHVFMRSTSEWAEDAQDAFYDLKDALIARIREDRCMGTGGFESGYGEGFSVGEGGEPWLIWEMDPAETSDELTSGYLTVSFDAHQYEQG